MAVQSKVLHDPLSSVLALGTVYALALKRQPLITKAITSGCLSGLGNFIGQRLQGKTYEDFAYRSLAAFAAYGFLVGGPVTHFWLNILEKLGPKNPLGKLFIDRFIYGPLMLLLTLYLLSVFQGNGHAKSVASIKKTYATSLKANLKLWVVCQYINLNFVPLEYRTLFSNLIALIWNIYLSGRQNRKAKDS